MAISNRDLGGPESARRWWAFARLVRTAGIGVLAGIATGLLVGGLGGRAAMRIVALAAGADALGRVTDNGNQIGVITLEGTLDLVLFIGLLTGIGGGLLYVALRPWLSHGGRWRGLAFGLLLLGVLGSAFIDDANTDFRRFGSPALNVLLFATLFVLYGVVLAPLVEWLESALPAWPSRQSPRLWLLAASALVVVAALLGLLFVGLGTVGLLAAALGFDGEFFVGGALLLATLGAALAARAFAVRASTDMPLRHERHRRVTFAGNALLAAPLLAGLALTTRSIRAILEAG